MSRSILSLAAVLFVLSACDACQHPTVDPSSPTPPAPPPTPSPGSPCDLACAHLSALGCQEAKPSPHGITCAQTCGLVEDSGIVRWNPGCIGSVKSCSDVGSCAR